jgi:hypothetical protein
MVFAIVTRFENLPLPLAMVKIAGTPANWRRVAPLKAREMIVTCPGVWQPLPVEPETVVGRPAFTELGETLRKGQPPSGSQ